MGSDYSCPTCVEVEDTGNELESPIYQHILTFKENGGNLISTFRSSPDADTICKIIKTSKTKYNEKNAFGERELLQNGEYGEYKWINFGQFFEMVQNFAYGLNTLGLEPGDRVGIYSTNNIYWQLTFYACHISSLVPVPIYDSLGPNAAQYIIQHSECKAVVCNISKMDSLINALNSQTNVEEVLVMNDTFEEEVKNGVHFQSLKKIMEKGSKLEEKPVLREPNPDDLGIIMYTSGSTGNPKGCLLTQRNLIAGATGLGNLGTSFTDRDVYLSFLPLAHIYEMGVELICMNQGTSVGFYTGCIANLMKDINALKPTIICAVPRVWNRIYSTMQSKIDSLPFLKRNLVKTVLAQKNFAIENHRPISLLCDIVLSPFRQALGGRVRLVVSGGAPILPDVFNFMRAGICPNIIQGYGLTEVGASVCVSEVPTIDSCDNGTVSITSQVKLRAVEGMKYNPRGEIKEGEILIRGPHVFQGYYKQNELTKEVLQDGWFATGDIGRITKEGHINIIDRAKQLVKLSQGEYLSITTLTDIYGSADGILNIYIYADSMHDAPAAVVVPNKEIIKEWKLKGIDEFQNSTACKKEILDNLNECATKNKLRGFERIKYIYLETAEFTVDNGLLTPSMKPQWQSLRKKYESIILELMKTIS